MKRTDAVLLAAVILYSWMFYNQSAGINFLIFSIAMICCLLVINVSLLKDKFWVISASGSMLTSAAVMYYGSTISVIANVISLSMMSAFSVSRKSSVFLSLFYSFFSYITSIIYMIIDAVERSSGKNKETTGKNSIKALMWVIISLIVIIFFFLYQKSNPLFRNLTEQINFDFITFRWIAFTLLGFILLYGFFYHRNIKSWYKREISSPDDLDEKLISERNIRFFGKSININTENRAGVVLFFVLNALLLVVNILDVVYLWGGGGLPEGMTYAENVRQGTGTLIFSVVFAIILILYIFRGHQNFFDKKKSLVILVVIWIIQNAFMTFSTAYRNLLYVQEYSLTYRRIGVWFYLLLALTGLVFTFVKIWKKKNNWYLFRKNGWAFYLVLVIAAFINWPVVVTQFNKSNSGELDKQYLLNLSYANIPELLTIKAPADKISVMKDNNINDYRNNDFFSCLFSKGNIYDLIHYDSNYSWVLHTKIYDFMASYDNTSWQSYCINKSKVIDDLLEADRKGEFNTLLLRRNYRIASKTSLAPVALLTNVENIDFGGNNLLKLSELNSFQKLKTLGLSNNSLQSLKDFPALPNLKVLYLSYNKINILEGLEGLSSLEILDLSANENINLKGAEKYKTIKQLDLSENSLTNLIELSKMPALTSLKLSNMKNNDFKTLQVIPSLVSLDISSNSLNSGDFYLIYKLKDFPALKEINLAGNEIGNLFFVNYYKSIRNDLSRQNPESYDAFYRRLETLDFSDNHIYSVEGIERFSNLKNLNLSYNKLSDLNPLKNMSSLLYLDITGNQINDLSPLYGLKQLKELRISKVPSSHIEKLKLNLPGTRIYSF